VPAGWVDGCSPGDPFVAVSAGRSPFRTADLLELAELFGELDRNDRYAHHAGHLHLTIPKYLFGREARLLIRAPRSNCKTTLPLTTYRSAHMYKTTQRPLFGMTVRLIAVILVTSFGLLERLPGALRSAMCMLSGGDDALDWSQRYKANLEKLGSGIGSRSLR
jgi:hypothetical protein